MEILVAEFPEGEMVEQVMETLLQNGFTESEVRETDPAQTPGKRAVLLRVRREDWAAAQQLLHSFNAEMVENEAYIAQLEEAYRLPSLDDHQPEIEDKKTIDNESLPAPFPYGVLNQPPVDGAPMDQP